MQPPRLQQDEPGDTNQTVSFEYRGPYDNLAARRWKPTPMEPTRPLAGVLAPGIHPALSGRHTDESDITLKPTT